MTMPTFPAGHEPGADEFAALLPIYVRKTVDESLASNTTLQNDDELFCAVAANITYEVDLFLIYDGATAGDLKFAFTGPTSATLDWVQGGLISSADATSGSMFVGASNIGTTNTVVTGAGAGVKLVTMPRGLLITSSTAGTFQLQWAQGTSSATATHVFAGSWMRLRRVA